jgi:NitT/TauT family transport system permease protein
MTAVTEKVPQRPPVKGTEDSGLLRFVKKPIVARLLFPTLVIALWVFVDSLEISRVFPAPDRVLDFMWNELRLETLARTNLYETLGISLLRLFAGFAVSMVVGTAIGLGMGLSKSVDAFFHDWVMAILAMPALVWALFLGLVFGFGSTGPVLATILAGIPFVIINVREGVRNTPRELFDMASAFDVPRNRMTRHLLIPSLMPFMFAAARYGFSVGWKGLVLAEVFASDRGMGWMIKFWYDAHRSFAVVGYAFFFVIFAFFLEKFVFDKLYARAFRWRPDAGAIDLVEEEITESFIDALDPGGAPTLPKRERLGED